MKESPKYNLTSPTPSTKMTSHVPTLKVISFSES